MFAREKHNRKHDKTLTVAFNAFRCASSQKLFYFRNFHIVSVHTDVVSNIGYELALRFAVSELYRMMKDGEIDEMGTYDELMSKMGPSPIN